MSWDSVTDFDINKAVAKLQGHKCYYDNDSFTNGLMGNAVVVKGKNVSGAINYCNSWADMGPLIVDYRINLSFSHISLKVFANRNEHGYRHHANPLRAAAIVYLMINDVKPEDLV